MPKLNEAFQQLSEFPKSPALRSIAVVTLGTGGSQILLLLASPALTRLYSPKAFGQFALLVAVAAVSATVVTLRYETTIQLPKDDDEARRLLAVTGAVAVLCTVLLAIATFIYVEVAPSAAPLRSLEYWLSAAVLCGFASAMIAAGSYWLNRKYQYGKAAVVKVFQSLVLVALSLALGSIAMHDGLMFSYVAAMALSLALCLWYIWRDFRLWQPADLFCAARRFSSTPKYLLVANLIDSLTLQLPVVLVALWFGDALAGQFGLAWRVLAAPIALLGVAVGQVFYQRAASVWPNRAATKQILHKAWKGLAILGFLPALAVLLFGEELFEFIFGAGWRDAGKIASVLSIMLFGLFVASPTSTIFLVMGLQKWMPIFSLAQLAYRPLAIYLGSINRDLTTGLWVWVSCEIAVMFFYHQLAYRKLAHQGQAAV